MYLTDFEYDGRRLSELGFMPCSIVTGSSDTSTLSTMSLNTFRNNENFVYNIASVEYNEPQQYTFDVAKNPCLFEDDSISADEISYFMKWLNRESYREFIPIYDKEEEYDDIVFYGTFNIEAIKFGGKIIGLTLTFTPNSSFGFTKEREFRIKNDDFFSYINTSDKEGFLYPKTMEIECISDGEIRIESSVENNVCIIKNCTAGEIITLNGINKIITSNKEHLTLADDFNYSYPRFLPGKNRFSFNNKINLYIVVQEARKAGIYT